MSKVRCISSWFTTHDINVQKVIKFLWLSLKADWNWTFLGEFFYVRSFYDSFPFNTSLTFLVIERDREKKVTRYPFDRTLVVQGLECLDFIKSVADSKSIGAKRGLGDQGKAKGGGCGGLQYTRATSACTQRSVDTSTVPTCVPMRIYMRLPAGSSPPSWLRVAWRFYRGTREGLKRRQLWWRWWWWW